jgi:hypothetical protein
MSASRPPLSRRSAAILLVGFVVLFIVQFVALVTGAFVVSAVCVVLFILGWFAMRRLMRSTPS